MERSSIVWKFEEVEVDLSEDFESLYAFSEEDIMVESQYMRRPSFAYEAEGMKSSLASMDLTSSWIVERRRVKVVPWREGERDVNFLMRVYRFWWRIL